MTTSRPADKAVRPAPGGTGRLESELAVLFRRVRELIRVAAVDVHPELNGTSYLVLVRLVDGGPLRASGLVDHFRTDKGTMSRQIAHLEQLRLVRRTKDPADGRAQVVTATPLAVRRCGRAREKSRAFIRERVADWDSDRIEAFADLMHEFTRSLATGGPDGAPQNR